MATPLGVTIAAILVVSSVAVGWLAIRSTAVALLKSGNSLAVRIAGDDPDTRLAGAMGSFVAARGTIKPRLLPTVRQAAAGAPLDARPYLLIGAADLQAGHYAQATTVLEAGQRLDPRQRWVHVLLLDRYLRTGRYSDAAAQFSVLARLVGSTQSAVANALAQMSIAPQTREAVRLTLQQDPALEQAVFSSLARSTIDPSLIFAMASPSALAGARLPTGWGSILVNRLVDQQDYSRARQIWLRLNGVRADQAALLYNSSLERLPASPPFNWALAKGGIAAVDMNDGRLSIEYYGRDSGELASQLLVLPPGRYRFAFGFSGSASSAGSKLSWTVVCANRPTVRLASVDLPAATNAVRQAAFEFAVATGCPAQRIILTGNAGEFPTTASVTIERLRLERLAGNS